MLASCPLEGSVDGAYIHGLDSDLALPFHPLSFALALTD
jgi:hypothetical protein